MYAYPARGIFLARGKQLPILYLNLICLGFSSIHLLTGYEGNITCIVPKVHQLLSEATPMTIVGTEGTMKVILPEYQVYECFIILSNCAIQNSEL